METETDIVANDKVGLLERRFAVRARGSTVSREVFGGLATFLTLSYILFVQPFVMSLALNNPSSEYAAQFQASVLTAVCLASALACVVMGLLANFPVALAPAMGHNFFFSLIVCKGMGFTWEQALAANLIAGGVFLLLSLAGMVLPRLDPRVLLFKAIPQGLQSAIGVGIGLLIALVGLEFAGIVIPVPGVGVGLGLGHTPWQPVAVALTGLAVFGACWSRNILGGPLWAIVISAVAAVGLDRLWPSVAPMVRMPDHWAAMPTLSATAFHLDFGGLFGLDLKAVAVAIATFLFLDVFDTVGTLGAVAQRAGLLPRHGEKDKGIGSAFLADAAGTVTGAALGTSTITSYVESLAGIHVGAKTGLAAIVVAVFFVLAMFLSPLVGVVASPYAVTISGATQSLYPCLAAVLIGIGALMLYTVRQIDWDDPTEALPCFLCMIIMPLTMSITDGIAFGFISYVVLKVLAGKWRQVHPFIAVCAALLVVRYAL